MSRTINSDLINPGNSKDKKGYKAYVWWHPETCWGLIINNWVISNQI